MKSLLLIILSIITFGIVKSQTVYLKYFEGSAEIQLIKDIKLDSTRIENKFFFLKFENYQPGDKFYIEIKDEDKREIIPDGKFTKLEFNNNVRNKDISIYLNDTKTPFLTFNIPTFKPKDDKDKSAMITLPKESAEAFVLKNYPNSLIIKPYGLLVKYEPNNNYSGANYIHVFYDQYGNSLISTPPQGIAGMQYIVHIIYLKDKYNPNVITYSVSQTAGSFSDNIEILNANSLNGIKLANSGGAGSPQKTEYEWAESRTLLSTSTTDIKFDIYRNILKNPDDSLKAIKIQQSSDNTIKMTKVYHANISVGVFNTFLSNPTYNLSASTLDTSKFVVTTSNVGPRALVTANVLLYVSPVLFFENLRDNKKDNKIPDYMPYGRNFLNNPTNPLEKIYPFVGLGLNDTILDNFFFGVAWEFARGSSISLAYHGGKVNTFRHNQEFIFGESLISKDDFTSRNGVGWKGNFAVGILLDASIISNLVKSAN